ncbi:hypothetical protein GALL_148800 [mine drainage metagenome]|uniref:Uncharacterized protein n=1 Tax=mine drainage metagenome TaxID=410659 RepID=A0A1J5SSS2_9ZZZZ
MNRRRFVQPALGLIALDFGLLTIGSGGHVLFGGKTARRAAGHYVPFVLWFNFAAGFAYISAALAILRSHPWAARLALGIAVSSAIVFAALGIHIAMGGAFELRTIAAMTFRTLT